MEEIDHLLCVASRVVEGRPFSLLELELQANITKYLVAQHFLARQANRKETPEPEKVWLRYHLFEKSEFVDADPDVRTASRA